MSKTRDYIKLFLESIGHSCFQITETTIKWCGEDECINYKTFKDHLNEWLLENGHTCIENGGIWCGDGCCKSVEGLKSFVITERRKGFCEFLVNNHHTCVSQISTKPMTIGWCKSMTGCKGLPYGMI
jgi:hypothetical protein